MIERILKLQKVLDARAVSKSTHYASIANGLFTSPVKLGARASGWPEREVSELNAARIAGKSDAEIHELVERLMRLRNAGRRG